MAVLNNLSPGTSKSIWSALFILVAVLANFYSFSQEPETDTTGQHSKRKIKITAYPAAGYSPETSLSLGAVGFLIFNNQDNQEPSAYYRPSSVSPYFLYTFNKQFLSAIDFEFFFPKNLNYNTTVRYFNYPDYFYGTGKNTTSERESYTNRFFKWDGNFSRALSSDFFLGIAYEWLINDIKDLDPNGILVNENVPGIEGGRIIGMGPVLRYDTRNNILYPESGIYFELKPVFFADIGGNDYVFNDILIDFRFFKQVFSEKNILGLQFHYRQATGNVPFYKLARLGGDIRLRGLEHEYRYIDHHASYLQLEGRRELFWRLGGVLFAGIGNVASGFSTLGFNDLKYVVGAGGRFRPFKDEKLNVRLDIGKGPGDQFAIYVAVKEAF